MSKSAFDYADGTPFGEAFIDALKDGANHELLARGPILQSRGVVAVLHPQISSWDSEQGLVAMVRRLYFGGRPHAHQLWLTKAESGWLMLTVDEPGHVVTSRSRWFGYYDRHGTFHMKGIS